MIEVKTMILDTKTGRPACVLLQAVYGGSQSLCYKFNSRSWLTSPTASMEPVAGTDEEWVKLADRINKKFPKQVLR